MQMDNSMSVLLGWWTTEGNYSKYHGGKDHGGQSKDVYWQIRHIYNQGKRNTC